ncbi:MAG: cysteine dioxygenase family protein [Oligoflexales bacterium]|nr:cysteine dioxygenase family protein [Oligoflexales bacterium]
MGNALSNLVKLLQNSPIEDFQSILAQAKVTAKDVQGHCFFSDQYYTRNLVCADKHFELIVLCWRGKQRTPIHDHNNSEGWLKVVEGKVTETIYEWDKILKKANLQNTISHVELEPGGTSHVNDDMGVHTICNPSTQDSITLHLYAPRIEKCHYVDTKNASIKEKILGFYSIAGKPQADS